MAVILPQRVSLAKFRLVDNLRPKQVVDRLFLTAYYTLAQVCYNTALVSEIDMGTNLIREREVDPS